MKNFNRRGMLGMMGASALGLMALSACTTVNEGGVTTHTLDVQKVKNYAQAGINAAKTIALAFAPFPELADTVAKAQAVVLTLEGDLAAFTASVGDSISVSYGDLSVKGLVDTLLAGVSTVLDIATALNQTVLGQIAGVSDALIQKANILFTSLQTIVSVFQVLIGTITTASGSGVSEAQALLNLGVS